MEVVLRPVNDLFLDHVVFPAFRMGVVDVRAALEHLLKFLNDEETRVNLELMLERDIDGTLFGLEDARWSQACYRLLFSEWIRDVEGWTLAGQFAAGYAGSWEATLHLALMLENPDYPYGEPHEARQFRQNFHSYVQTKHRLSSLICGLWDPAPDFPPDQILTVQGAGTYEPEQGVARADWSWRSYAMVNQVAAQLPNMLSSLLQREARRLAPVVAPERHEILDYWLGRTEEPPVLTVSFSGLGQESASWIRELGTLARMIRTAASANQGMTAVLSRVGGSEFE